MTVHAFARSKRGNQSMILPRGKQLRRVCSLEWTSAVRRAIFQLLVLAAPAMRSLGGQSTVRANDNGLAPRTSAAHPRAEWSLDPAPALVLGGASSTGPLEFSGVAGVRLASDGRVAVADARAREIRVFGPDGRFVRRFGRAGRGPGEFDGIWSVFRSADTLMVVDNSGRAVVVDFDGRVLRTLARPYVAGATEPTRIGLMPDGRAIVTAVATRSPALALDSQREVLLGRESPTGSWLGTLFPLRVAPKGLERQLASDPAKFAPSVKVAVGFARICSGVSDSYDLVCRDSSGNAPIRIRRAIRRRATSDEDRAYVRAMNVAANRGVAPRVMREIEEENRLMRFAPLLPVLGRVAISAIGELWVSEFDRGEDGFGPPSMTAPNRAMRWSVYSADGVWLSDVVLPAHFVPQDFGRDYVAGVSFDRDQVEQVIIWRIRR